MPSGATMLFADAWLAGRRTEGAGPSESIGRECRRFCHFWSVTDTRWPYRSTWGKSQQVASVNLGESSNFSFPSGQNMSLGSGRLSYRSTWGESPSTYRSTWGNTKPAVSVNLGGKGPELSVNLGAGGELFRSTWGEKGQNYRSTWGETMHIYRSTWGGNSAQVRD